MLIGFLLATAATAFHVHQISAELRFEYKWPSQASEIPTLRKQLIRQMNHDRARYSRMAAADRTEETKQSFPFRPYDFVREIRFDGQTSRLASFADQRWAFTGGAHGNGATTGLLWDRAQGKELSFVSLFLSANGLSPLRGPYCRALNAERKKRRGVDYQKSTITEFDTCPKFSDLALIPSDSAHDGMFDQVHLIAAPYLVGPYAEGEYDIALPVTGQLIAAMKAEYRASFEAQWQ